MSSLLEAPAASASGCGAGHARARSVRLRRGEADDDGVARLDLSRDHLREASIRDPRANLNGLGLSLRARGLVDRRWTGAAASARATGPSASALPGLAGRGPGVLSGAALSRSTPSRSALRRSTL